MDTPSSQIDLLVKPVVEDSSEKNKS